MTKRVTTKKVAQEDGFRAAVTATKTFVLDKDWYFSVKKVHEYQSTLNKKPLVAT